MTAPTPEELVERLAVAYAIEQVCGLKTPAGQRVACDDWRATDAAPKHTCDCRAAVRALLAEIHKLGLRIVPTLANNAMILAIRDETNAEMTESISAWNSALAAAPNYTGGGG